MELFSIRIQRTFQLVSTVKYFYVFSSLYVNLICFYTKISI